MYQQLAVVCIYGCAVFTGPAACLLACSNGSDCQSLTNKQKTVVHLADPAVGQHHLGTGPWDPEKLGTGPWGPEKIGTGPWDPDCSLAHQAYRQHHLGTGPWDPEKLGTGPWGPESTSNSLTHRGLGNSTNRHGLTETARSSTGITMEAGGGKPGPAAMDTEPSPPVQRSSIPGLPPWPPSACNPAIPQQRPCWRAKAKIPKMFATTGGKGGCRRQHWNWPPMRNGTSHQVTHSAKARNDWLANGQQASTHHGSNSQAGLFKASTRCHTGVPQNHLARSQEHRCKAVAVGAGIGSTLLSSAKQAVDTAVTDCGWQPHVMATEVMHLWGLAKETGLASSMVVFTFASQQVTDDVLAGCISPVLPIGSKPGQGGATQQNLKQTGIPVWFCYPGPPPRTEDVVLTSKSFAGGDSSECLQAITAALHHTAAQLVVTRDSADAIVAGTAHSTLSLPTPTPTAAKLRTWAVEGLETLRAADFYLTTIRKDLALDKSDSPVEDTASDKVYLKVATTSQAEMLASNSFSVDWSPAQPGMYVLQMPPVAAAAECSPVRLGVTTMAALRTAREDCFRTWTDIRPSLAFARNGDRDVTAKGLARNAPWPLDPHRASDVVQSLPAPVVVG